MHLPHFEGLEHGPDRRVGLADQHRAHQAMGEPLLPERMLLSQFGEIVPVVDQAKIELFRRPLIVEADQAIHHLLKFLAPLQKIGLHPILIAGFDQLLQPHLIPALAHTEFQGIGEVGDPVARQAGWRLPLHPLPKALDDDRLLFGSKAHALPQLAQQVLLGHGAQDAVLKQQLSEGLAGLVLDTGQQFGFEVRTIEHQALAEPETLTALLSRSVTATARS